MMPQASTLISCTKPPGSPCPSAKSLRPLSRNWSDRRCPGQRRSDQFRDNGRRDFAEGHGLPGGFVQLMSVDACGIIQTGIVHRWDAETPPATELAVA